MARAYRMTPARRAALRKAQIASARARRKGYRADVRKARSRRNVQTKKRGSTPMSRAAAVRRYDQDVNIARVKHLGKKSRTLKQQRNRRVAKEVGKGVAYSAATYLLVHPHGNQTLVKGARVAKASPRYAQGFKRGYQQSRARQQAQRRTTTVHRVSPRALPAGTGRKAYSGRRVRGY